MAAHQPACRARLVAPRRIASARPSLKSVRGLPSDLPLMTSNTPKDGGPCKRNVKQVGRNCLVSHESCTQRSTTSCGFIATTVNSFIISALITRAGKHEGTSPVKNGFEPRPVMHRVLVVGSGGAGKSTFAARLSQRTGIPLVHLDAQYWRPGWVEPTAEAWAATLDRLVQPERWIMDGNYGGSLAQRIDACDTVIFLDMPRWLCLWRVLQRPARYRGRSRPDMTPGCPERLSLSFLGWILSYPHRHRPQILQRLSHLRPDQRAVHLRSTNEAERFLSSQ